MPIVKSNEFAHVRITVSDITKSKAFYDDVFGWDVAVDQSSKIDEPGVKDSPEQFFGGVVYQLPSGELFGLRPSAPVGQRFDSGRTGLDHISFKIASRSELVDIAEKFAAKGIEHGAVTDLSAAGMAILSFSDPDGVHCELMAPL